MKTMKPILIAVAIFGIATTAMAQEHWMGVQAGLQVQNVYSKNSTLRSADGLNLFAGATYSFQFTKPFFAEAGLQYNRHLLGYYTELGNTIDARGNHVYLTEPADIKCTYDYISIPLTAGAAIGHKFFGFAGIGLIPSILINANKRVPSFTYGYRNGDKYDDYLSVLRGDLAHIDESDLVSRFDLAGMVAIGLGGRIGERWMLNASFAYRYSFTPIYKHGAQANERNNSNLMPTIADEHAHYGCAGVTIGLCYKIAK